jgi:hypothetical protein
MKEQMMNVRNWLALAAVLLALLGPGMARAATPQLGYTTAALDRDADSDIILQASGSLVAYLDGTQLIVRHLATNQKMFETTFTPPLARGVFALEKDELAWVGSGNVLTLVDLATAQRTTLNLDPAWRVRKIALTPDWYVVAWNMSDEHTTIQAINRRSGESRVIGQSIYFDVQAQGDWAMWFTLGTNASALNVYNLRTQTSRVIDSLALGTAPSIDGDWVAYVPYLTNNVVVINLVDGRREEYPNNTGDYVQLAGDFLVWTRLQQEQLNLVVHQRSTGLERTITPDVDYDNFDLTSAPAPTVVWVGGGASAGLFATQVQLVTPPAAMDPETASSAPGSLYFPVTRHNLATPFSGYWQDNGALPQFGYPLSARFDELNADTQARYPTQYLERQRFEWHSEHAGSAYEVLLGRLGAEILSAQGRDWQREGHDQPGVEQLPGECQTFDITQRSVCGPFLSYWRTHGLDLGQGGISYAESLALFGLPLTAPRYETNPDGDRVLTQWFERARFEYHPDNPDAYKVLLGRLGAELLTVRGWQP